MQTPLTLRLEDGKPFAKENSFALLAGVGRREGDSEQMQVTASDADMLRRALVKAFDLFDEKKVTTLINGEATAAGIIVQLDLLIESTKINKADFVIIYFSGHGYVREGKYFLIANDTLPLKKEDININTADFATKKNAIEGTLFAEKLTAIDCSKMLVLLDCCHSAGMAMKPVDENTFKDCPNRVIITACGKSQVSYLSKPVSIFTYALIEALGGKFLTGTDATVTIFSLGMAVSARVAALSKMILPQNTMPQKPEMDVLENSQTINFPIARYSKGGAQEVRLLKEEIKSISTEDGTKQFYPYNLETPEQDNEFRKKFYWLENKIIQTNTTTIAGNNNTVTNNNQATNTAAGFDTGNGFFNETGDYISKETTTIKNGITQKNETTVDGNNNRVTNNSVTGGNNSKQFILGEGSNVFVEGEPTVQDLKKTLVEKIDYWKSYFKDGFEKGLEDDINEINIKIDKLKNE